MANESTSIVGSGVSILREHHAIRVMRGSNSVLVNYEDINSKLGILQCSGLIVGTAAIHVNGPATRLRGRRQVHIENLGPGAVFIGGSASVTSSTGYRISASGEKVLDVLDLGDIFIISSSTADVRVMELR